MNIRYILYLLLFLFSGVTASFSVSASENPLFEKDLDNLKDLEIDDYVLPTLQNLSKLYWKIGKLDLDNDEQIDSYLVINECDLYLHYYHNDFDWAKIRNATREHIVKHMADFPSKFEIIAPIYLGRYDIKSEEFEIPDEYQIKNLKRLDFKMNVTAYRDLCTKTGEIYDYPPNLIVILNRPLVLKTIPVKRELARLYIEDAKRNYDTLPLRLQMRRYERLIFIRLKIRVTQYKNTLRVLGDGLRGVVFGRLDGFEIYADQAKTKPLYFKDLRKKRFRRLRTKSEDLSGKEPVAEGGSEDREEDVQKPKTEAVK